MIARYELREEDQLYRIACDLGWQKLNEYYTKLDRSPIYVAALVLHPAYKIETIEQLWQARPDWIEWARQVIQELWQRYKNKRFKQPQQQDSQQDDWLSEFLRSRTDTDRSERFASSSSDTRLAPQEIDELDEYLTTRDRIHKSVKNPVEFWHHNRDRWPCHTQMAFDIFSIPATEADNERTFSKLGDMITKKRYLLQSDLIGASQSLVQWDMDGAIDWR